MTAIVSPRLRRDRPAPEPARVYSCAASARLRSILYVSSATRAMTSFELQQLVRDSRARNGALGITGILLYRAGNFIQYLEGPAAGVGELHLRIRRDRRHFSVITILDCEIGSRAFADMALRFQDLDGADDGGALWQFAPESGTKQPPGVNGVALRILDRFRQHRHLRPAAHGGALLARAS